MGEGVGGKYGKKRRGFMLAKRQQAEGGWSQFMAHECVPQQQGLIIADERFYIPLSTARTAVFVT